MPYRGRAQYRQNYRERSQFDQNYRDDFRRGHFRGMQNYRGLNFRGGYRGTGGSCLSHTVVKSDSHLAQFLPKLFFSFSLYTLM